MDIVPLHFIIDKLAMKNQTNPKGWGGGGGGVRSLHRCAIMGTLQHPHGRRLTFKNRVFLTSAILIKFLKEYSSCRRNDTFIEYGLLSTPPLFTQTVHVKIMAFNFTVNES